MRLTLRNLWHAGARSVAVAAGAALVAAFVLLSSMVVAGAQQDLALGVRRLGADVFVFPWGTDISGLRAGYLEPASSGGLLQASDVSRIAAVPGVEAASPQLYLGTVSGLPGDAAEEIRLAAFDPLTDFALEPWMESSAYRRLGIGQALAGGLVSTGGTGTIDAGGYPLAVAGRLAVTGTDMDQAIFVSFDTAADMARSSPNAGEDAVEPPLAPASVVLVRIKRGEDVREAAANIMDRVRGSLALANARMLQGQRAQLFGLQTAVLALSLAIWALSIVFIGLVFTMTVNARRRQIGVLRGLGSPRSFVVRSLVAEGALLGIAGGAAGVLLAAVLALVIRAAGNSFGLPFVVPGPARFLGLAALALGLSAGSVAIASSVPALRISRTEPAQAMRE